MRLLALDIGGKRTGIAFVDTANNIPLPLDTVVADDAQAMIDRVKMIVDERGVERIIVGLPLLPSGGEGAQVVYVRRCAESLKALGYQIDFIDERHTTSDSKDYDGDARAACELLRTYLDRQ